MKKILIVEDEIIIGLDIASKLRKLGYDIIETVTSPDEALSLLTQCEPDLILMDINLKGEMDGIALGDVIKEKYNIPMVFMTSYSDGTMIDRAMNAEPYGYLIKPYTEGALIAMLKTSFTRLELERKNNLQGEMLNNIMDSITDAVAVVDNKHNLERINRKFKEIFDVDDPTGESLESVFDGLLDYEAVKKLYDEKSQDILNININGTQKHILISVSDFFWSTGSKLLLTITDLTEMYSMKSALTKAEQKFTKIFRKKMVPAVLVTCPEMVIFEMNDAFLDLYKTKPGVYVDREISCLIGSEAVQLIKDSMDDEESVRADMLKQKDVAGRDFYANIRGKKVEFDGHSYLLLDFADMTEQVRISEIEKDLQQKLIHANKMTSLGTLVSGVAHEINNPNNFIMFNSSLLLDFWKDIFTSLQSYGCESIGGMSFDEFRGDIENLMSGINNGSERIKNIVQDLKGFAKTENINSFEPLDVEEVLRTAVRILEHQISKSTDNFVLDIEAGLPIIKGNTQKLEQVFINIIMNALEAIQTKTSLVQLRCYRADNMVIIEVKDEGVGIPQESLDRITEPFFTTKQSSGGTGLGLSIAYTIVQEHSGTIDISSVIGTGSVVQICFPEIKNG